MKKVILSFLIVWPGFFGFTQDWIGIPVPADAGPGKTWQLDEAVSDDFSYTADADNKGDIFKSKWKDSYVNGWTGGSNTTWTPGQSYVNGSMLALDADRKPGTTNGVLTGCISALQTVIYPVYIETSAKLSTSVLASCFWMVSLDQTQEIDIIEAFGTDRPNKEWYNQRQHLSHHVFVRTPFQDYQPTDVSSWYTDGTTWRDDFHRVGVYWLSPIHLEYYIDGELVRVVYDKAFANKKNGTWYYTYPTMTDGVLDKSNGYQTVLQYATGSQYSFQTLEDASNTSDVSVIDAYGYTEGGLTKAQHLLVTTAQQSWTGMEATDDELEDKSKSIYYLDWIRVYKAVNLTDISSKTEEKKEIRVYPQPFRDRIHIETTKSVNQLDFYKMNGTLIHSEKMSGNSITISTENLPSGFYFLKVLSADGSFSGKKVVKI